MSNWERNIDVCLLSIGSAYSLANIESILGIIILVIQLIWFTIKFVSKIVNAIKSGSSVVEVISENADEFIEIVDDVRDAINKEGGSDNGHGTES